jgi:hypothetical protein
MKILPVGDELFHAEGQKNRTKLTGAFRHFANASKHTLHSRAPGLLADRRGAVIYTDFSRPRLDGTEGQKFFGQLTVIQLFDKF